MFRKGEQRRPKTAADRLKKEKHARNRSKVHSGAEKATYS
jgi:hypothetical protein